MKMNTTDIIEVETKNEWRKWLSYNHDTRRIVWLLFRKGKDKRPLTYGEALEEALCYGWIDSIVKRIDDEKYVRKFTPRSDIYKWSIRNIGIAKEVSRTKRMTKHGLSRLGDGVLDSRKAKTKTLELDPQLEKRLRENKTAWKNFSKMAPSYQKRYVGWIQSAKKEETRLKRLAEAEQLLERGLRLERK